MPEIVLSLKKQELFREIEYCFDVSRGTHGTHIKRMKNCIVCLSGTQLTEPAAELE